MPEAADFVLRPPDPSDHETLAELMLDAYRGTIDYEGEGIEEARSEVASYFGGSPLLGQSLVIESGTKVAAACLVNAYGEGALVGYVMTTPELKGRGLGTLATTAALSIIQEAGYGEVHAWITEGNVPSERIFLGLGFEVVDSSG